ncbi:MAG: hypothetical protein ACPGGH_06960 [Chitinophagales bacterium]
MNRQELITAVVRMMLTQFIEDDSYIDLFIDAVGERRDELFEGKTLSDEEIVQVLEKTMDSFISSGMLYELLDKNLREHFDARINALIGVPLKLKDTIVRTDRETGEETIIKINDSERDYPSDLEA